MAKKEKAVKAKEPSVIYYQDELTDEFSTAQITPKVIDGNYRYDRSKGIHGLLRFFWYGLIAPLPAFLYRKLKFRHKILGREKLKKHKKEAIFLFGNHTQPIGDAVIPSFIRYPAYIIVHPNNVSMPCLGRINPYLGALPLPDDMGAAKNFVATIKKKVEKKRAIFIYPEAHIWPYYTGIRPFGAESFQYPVKYGTPVYAFTNTYQKRRFSHKPRILTYIDGPFYPDTALPPRARREQLRNEVYNAMTERSKLSDCVVIEYKKAEEETI
ncbi:MAG: hypothetical protein E7585_09100 [Ruminococcaceae bacterium]|nr:hypothetical protein [Oscillospiraceae bacterium]